VVGTNRRRTPLLLRAGRGGGVATACSTGPVGSESTMRVREYLQEITMGKREDRTDEDRQYPPHKPQGSGSQQPGDPDKPEGRHHKPDKRDDK
jgi:hypothetical protein